MNREERLVLSKEAEQLVIRVENLRGWITYTLQVFFYYEEPSITWGTIKEESWYTGLDEFLLQNVTRVFQFDLTQTLEGFAVIPVVKEVAIYLERDTITVQSTYFKPVEEL